MNINETGKFVAKVKKVGGSLVCILAVISIVGCGTSGSSNPTKTPVAESKQPVVVTVDVAALAKELFEKGDYSDELTELEDDMFEAVFQTVDIGMLTKKSAYVGSGASAEQLVVAEVKDEANANKVKEALGQKLKDDIDMNQNYLPQEIKKLENPVLVVKGKYVILCVSNDNNKIEQVLLKKGLIS